MDSHLYHFTRFDLFLASLIATGMHVFGNPGAWVTIAIFIDFIYEGWKRNFICLIIGILLVNLGFIITNYFILLQGGVYRDSRYKKSLRR